MGVNIPGFRLMNNSIMNMLQDYSVGDILKLRKPHPCGGDEWVVTRLGADIGLECLTCKRRILLPRRELNRRIKQIRRLNEVERREP